MPTYRQRGQRYKRPRRSRHFLTYVPPGGVFCIGPRPEEETRRDPSRGIHGDFTPLVCHRIFQDALEDQDIPRDQGVTSKGIRRNIRCEGIRITDTDQVPYRRSDGRPIYQVKNCGNFTRKNVWLGGRWEEVEERNLGQAPELAGHHKITIGVACLFLLRVIWASPYLD